jgi:membrane protein
VERAAKAHRVAVNAAWLRRLLPHGPGRPSQLSAASWWGAIGRTLREFAGDDLFDRAAALTYYAIQSLFPGLLVLVAVLGLLGRRTTAAVLDNISALAPGSTRDIIAGAVTNLQRNRDVAGVLAIVGVLVAFWSASSYIGAFMRAANAIYDVPEGRPAWKTLPIRVVITAVTGALLAVSAVAVVLTGRLAQQMGRLVGVDERTVRLFDVVKWPVLAIAMGSLVALLYWAAPNARPGFRWITPGTVLAVVLWSAASAGFAYYVSHVSSYNRTYGAIGGVIVFLIWLWLSNVAILVGAEFDAELGRSRAIEAGYPRDAEPYVALRQVPKPREARRPDGGR